MPKRTFSDRDPDGAKVIVNPDAIGLMTAVFIACAVEVVEAFTIVLAMGITRGWRSAVAGTATALVTRVSIDPGRVVLAARVVFLGVFTNARGESGAGTE